jgi:hypothetical protein
LLEEQATDQSRFVLPGEAAGAAAGEAIAAQEREFQSRGSEMVDLPSPTVIGTFSANVAADLTAFAAPEITDTQHLQNIDDNTTELVRIGEQFLEEGKAR